MATKAISGNLNFNTVIRIRGEGCRFIIINSNPVFDLKDITIEDSAALALLLALTRFAKQLNREIKFINIPKQLLDMIKLGALEDILPLKT